MGLHSIRIMLVIIVAMFRRHLFLRCFAHALRPPRSGQGWPKRGSGRTVEVVEKEHEKLPTHRAHSLQGAFPVTNNRYTLLVSGYRSRRIKKNRPDGIRNIGKKLCTYLHSQRFHGAAAQAGLPPVHVPSPHHHKSRA